MALFLVQGKVSKTGYMEDRSKPFDDTRLVEANDELEAGKKFEQFWRKKSSEYSTYYSASVESASGIITDELEKEDWE